MKLFPVQVMTVKNIDKKRTNIAPRVNNTRICNWDTNCYPQPENVNSVHERAEDRDCDPCEQILFKGAKFPLLCVA